MTIKLLIEKLAQIPSVENIPNPTQKFINSIQVKDAGFNEFIKALNIYKNTKQSDDKEFYNNIISQIYSAYEEEIKDIDLLTADLDKINDILLLSSVLITVPEKKRLVQKNHGILQALTIRPKVSDNIDYQIQQAASSNLTNNPYAKKLATLGGSSPEQMFNSYLLANTLSFVATCSAQNTKDAFYETIKNIMLTDKHFNFKNIHPKLVFDSIVSIIKKQKLAGNKQFFDELETICNIFGLPEQLLKEAFNSGEFEFEAFETQVNKLHQSATPTVFTSVQPVANKKSPSNINNEEAPTGATILAKQLEEGNDQFIDALIDGYKAYQKLKEEERFSVYGIHSAAKSSAKAVYSTMSQYNPFSSTSSSPSVTPVSSEPSIGFSAKKDVLIDKINPNNLPINQLSAKNLSEDQKYAAVFEFFKYVMTRYNDKTPDRLYTLMLNKLAANTDYQYVDRSTIVVKGERVYSPKLVNDIVKYLSDDLNQSQPIANLTAYIERLTTLVAYFPQDLKIDVLFRYKEFREAFVDKHLIPYLMLPNAKIDDKLAIVLNSMVGIKPIEKSERESIIFGMNSLLKSFSDVVKAHPPGSRIGYVKDDCKRFIGKLTDARFGNNTLVARTILVLLNVANYSIVAHATPNRGLSYSAITQLLNSVQSNKGLAGYLVKYKDEFISQIAGSLNKLISSRGLNEFTSQDAKDFNDTINLLCETFSITKNELAAKGGNIPVLFAALDSKAKTLEESQREELKVEEARMQKETVVMGQSTLVTTHAYKNLSSSENKHLQLRLNDEEQRRFNEHRKEYDKDIANRNNYGL